MNRNTVVLVLTLLVLSTLAAAQASQYRADGPFASVSSYDFNYSIDLGVDTNWSRPNEPSTAYLYYSVFNSSGDQFMGWGEIPASALTLSGNLNSPEATLTLSVDTSDTLLLPNFANFVCRSGGCESSPGGPINVAWKKLNYWSSQVNGTTWRQLGSCRWAVVGTTETKSAGAAFEVLGIGSSTLYAAMGVHTQTLVSVKCAP